MSNKRPAPTFGIGVFFGLLVGSIVTIWAMSGDTSETFEDYRARQQAARGGGGSGAPRQQGGDPHARGGNNSGDPHGGASPRGGANPHGQDGGSRQDSTIKVPFMKKFVAALTEMPGNSHPNPDWKPLVKEGQAISCANCHNPQVIDIEKMKAQNPPAEIVARLAKAPQFMIPLMEKWVERLNKRNADKLVKPVTCTDCHAVDPRQKWKVYPALMNSFVKALSAPPENKHPAKGWKPLLKKPDKDALHCGKCHNTKHSPVGSAMERAIREKNPRLPLDRPPQADNKAFMVSLMEKWVKRVNRDMKDELVEPVTCRSCHESDPRR